MSGVIQADPVLVKVYIPCVELKEIPNIPATVRDPAKAKSVDDLIEQWNIDNNAWKKYADSMNAIAYGCATKVAPTEGAKKP